MALRDFSGWPDDQVPAWVLAARERARRERTLLCGTCSRHYGLRAEVLAHCRETGHTPLIGEVAS